MQKIRLAGTELDVSRFVFGTASLFNIRDRRARLALIDAAVDHGFTHFDTAPYYGFGHAERDLGEALRRHPGVTVTTKVGIHSPGGEEQGAQAVFARKAAGRLVKALSRPAVDFSLARAKAQMEGSRRRLARETIDLYMLHEPEVGLLNTDEWLGWLEGLKAAGTVRAFGLALTHDRLEPFLAQNSPLAQVVQVADSLEAREADVLAAHGRPMQITYAYVSAGFATNPQANVGQVLRDALARNATGAIIVSTKRPDRLGQYNRLLESEA